jgi:hypothetical protein
MKKIIMFSLLFISTTTFSQVLYMNPLCKVPCDLCVKDSAPSKVTYNADPQRQIILRTFEHSDGSPKSVHSLDKCKILDKKNWVCEGASIRGNPEAGKQFAVNGIAHWNDSDSLVDFDKKFGYRYSCRYEKNLLGKFITKAEYKKY